MYRMTFLYNWVYLIFLYSCFWITDGMFFLYMWKLIFSDFVFHVDLWKFASWIFSISLLGCFKLFLMLNFCMYCQDLVQYLKHACPAHLYATSISPPAAQQIISSIRVILGEDGSSRGYGFHLFCFVLHLYCSMVFLRASIQIMFICLAYHGLK